MMVQEIVVGGSSEEHNVLGRSLREWMTCDPRIEVCQNPRPLPVDSVADESTMLYFTEESQT